MENRFTPELRFPEFEGEWAEKKLEDIATFFSGGTPSSKNKKYYSGDIPFIGSGEISNKFTEKKVTEEAIDSSSAKYVKSGDLLYALYGATSGEVAISKINGVINQAVLCIKPQKIEKIFLYSILKFKKIKITTKYLQGGQGNLSAKIVRKLKFFFSNSIEEQQKIATFLTAIDQRILLLEKKKTALEQYKKGAMQKIFSQEMRFKKEDGTDFPDWEEKKLGNLGNTFNGLTGKTKVDFGEGKPYIQYMQIFSDSKINTTQFGLVKIEDGENQSKAQLGDVFFTTSSETPNEIGTASVLTEPVDEVYLNSFCFGFRPNSLDELIPEFSQFFFRSENVRRKIIPLAQGSTRFNMSKVELMKLKFEIPKKDEQEKIASFLVLIDKAIQKLESQIEDSKEFKKGLLQKMFV